MYSSPYTRAGLIEEYHQEVLRERKRFLQKGIEFVEEYFSGFGLVGKFLAEIRITDNSAKYRAAKDILNKIEENNFQIPIFFT